MNLRIFTFILVILMISWETLSSSIQEVFINANVSPLVNLILVYDSQAANSQVLKSAMEGIAKKRQGFFKVHMIDCEQLTDQQKKQLVYCADEHRAQLPALMFTKPSLNLKDEETGKINEAQMVPYQGGLDEKSLFNFAVPLMPTFSQQLKNQKDLRKFQELYKDAVKIIYYTDKQKISPFYKAITANFRNTIAFAHVFSTSQLAKDQKIEKYPAMKLNGDETIQIKSNLVEMVERLKMIKGQATTIIIKETVQSKIEELTQENLEENVYQQAQHILVQVIGTSGEEHPEWQNIQRKFKKMFKYYQTSTLNEKLGVKSTPAIVYFPKSLAKKQVQKTVFGQRDDIEDIQAQIDSMIDDFTVAISSQIELQKMTGIPLQQDKFVAVFFHEKQISLTYKILSNHEDFKEDIVFFRMRNPQPRVMEQFQIKKLPSLIVMMIDDSQDKPEPTEQEIKAGRVGMNLKLASYTGKFNYDELSGYFRTFVRKQPEPQQQVQGESNNVKEITKSSKFNTKCKDQTCYLLLLNGDAENKQKNEGYVALLEKQSVKIPQENFVYVDGICHSQIRGAFEIMEDELPALVYINSKFQKFARLVGRLESSSIMNLFGKVRSNKAMYRGYDKLSFENKDCQYEHDKLKKLTEQTVELSQQESQILDEIKAEEEKKREEFQKAAHEDKVRKKKRRRRPKQEEEEL